MIPVERTEIFFRPPLARERVGGCEGEEILEHRFMGLHYIVLNFTV